MAQEAQATRDDRAAEGPVPDQPDPGASPHRRIGEVLRRWRYSTGSTQKDVAEGMGISFQQLQKYESGLNRITLHRMVDYCAALGVPPQAVLSDILAACDWPARPAEPGAPGPAARRRGA